MAHGATEMDEASLACKELPERGGPGPGSQAEMHGMDQTLRTMAGESARAGEQPAGGGSKDFLSFQRREKGRAGVKR